jgi:hypothetical protein
LRNNFRKDCQLRREIQNAKLIAEFNSALKNHPDCFRNLEEENNDDEEVQTGVSGQSPTNDQG